MSIISNSIVFSPSSLFICHITPLSQSTTSLRGSRSSLLSPTKQDFSWEEDEEEYEEEEEVESNLSWVLVGLDCHLLSVFVEK